MLRACTAVVARAHCLTALVCYSILSLRHTRNGELSWLGRFIMASSVNSFCFGFAPIAAAAVTFSVYAALGNELRASVVFPSIGLFMLVRIPTQLVPLGVSMAAEVGVRSSWCCCVWRVFCALRQRVLLVMAT